MEGPIGYCFNRYLSPIWRRFGMMDGFAKDAGIDPLKADLEFLVDHVFVVGSPDTVVEKISTLFDACGGWGTLQVESHDYYDDPSPWRSEEHTSELQSLMRNSYAVFCLKQKRN